MTFQTKYLQLLAVQPTADGNLTALAAGNFRKFIFSGEKEIETE
jgi:hypothetical protein